MLRKVSVWKGEVLLCEYDIILRAENYTPSDEEWFQIARDNAVEDGFVKKDEISSLQCRFKD